MLYCEYVIVASGQWQCLQCIHSQVMYCSLLVWASPVCVCAGEGSGQGDVCQCSRTGDPSSSQQEEQHVRLLHAKNKLLSVSLSVCLSAFMTTCVTVVVCLCVL